MNYFLGVDIGTTSTKAVAINEQGDLVGKFSVDYEMLHPRNNYSELNPDEIAEAIFLCIRKVVSMLHPVQPLLVSFSSLMHSLIAVNEQGLPLTNCIIWADNRAASIAHELRLRDEGEQYYHSTGVPVHAMSPFCKLLWMKEHDESIFNEAYKFIGIKEYIFYKLFGVYVVDSAVASATGLLNLYSLQWDKAVMQELELGEERLSEVVSVEQVYQSNDHVNSLLQLEGHVPFVIGGSDGALANLSAGSFLDHTMCVNIGTSAALRILTDKPITEENMSIFCYHALGDQYIIGGASNNGAVVIQWLKETLLQTADSYESLFESAERIAVGSDDLFFIPYILGERAPVWNSDAKGVYFGFTINHTKAHMVRAAMEGITYNLYSIGRFIMKSTTVKAIYAAGGFAQSKFWLQLLADVFNCKVLVSGSPESSALGAVMVGINSLKLPFKIVPPIVAEYLPNPANHEIHHKQFAKFERLYKLFKMEFVSDDVIASVAVP
jgi:gluconokinase